jgi:hypothetical protein
MREEAHFDRLSVSEIYVDRNNQNMRAIVAVQLNIEDLFLGNKIVRI